MARTITQIQNIILLDIASNETLSTYLTSDSIYAVYRIFAFIIASAISIHEGFFDAHKKEVEEIIEQKFPHRPSWYRSKALAFQYGHILITDSDKYDNSGFTNDEITNSKIIKYSAVTQNGGQLLIKIASESGGVLSPITESQKVAFDAYIKEIADCGVKYIVVNNLPDILLLTLEVFINPLVLNTNGMSILNGNYPVEEAILQYMKELPFNGELVLLHLVDKLQLVEGVEIPNIINAQTQIFDGAGGYFAAQPITVKTVPESGYFTIPNFNGITYVV